MSRYLSIDQFLGYAQEFGLAVLFDEVGKHQFLVGVLVIDEQQPMVAVVGGHWQRQIAEIVIVVAKLLLLGTGGLVVRVEVKCAGGQRITPPGQMPVLYPSAT